MRTITFVALQCFQCSTMQVKQQKKSSNKWTCVVCNQRQSVRKVFAQGPMAKDIRFFVQSFNMSRGEQRSPDPETSMPLQGGDDGARKRRSDWTEYLDLEPVDEEKDGGDLGPRVLTELPKELFKKPKLKNYASESDGNNNMPLKPVFSKRSLLKSVEKEGRKDEIMEACKWGRNEKTKTCNTTMASKWSSYITQDDDDDDDDVLRAGNARNCGDKMGENYQKRMGEFRQSDDAWESVMEDHKVEDDVHPDFM